MTVYIIYTSIVYSSDLQFIPGVYFLDHAYRTRMDLLHHFGHITI